MIANLMLQLEEVQHLGRLDRYMMRSLLGPSILIIDEVGYVPLQPSEVDVAHVAAANLATYILSSIHESTKYIRRSANLRPD